MVLSGVAKCDHIIDINSAVSILHSTVTISHWEEDVEFLQDGMTLHSGKLSRLQRLISLLPGS